MTRRENLMALLTLAGPIAVSQVAQTSLGFVDTVMVGRLGAVPLSAVSIGVAVHYTLLMLALGTVMAVGPLASQAHGAKEPREVARYTRQGLWLATFLAPVIVAVEYAAPYWVHLLQQDAEVTPLIAEYLRAVCWSAWPFLAFTALRAWLESVGRPRPVTVIAVLAVAVNALANYVFVYGNFGFPGLGAVGAGYATSVSYGFLFLALTGYALSHSSLRAYHVLDRVRAPAAAYLRELLRVGFPMGITFALEVGFFSAMGILVGQLGTVQLAAHQISLQMASLSFMLPLAISMAVSIRVGNLIGAGQPRSATEIGWLAIGVGAAIMTVSAAVYALAPGAIIALFLGEGALEGEGRAVAALAAQLLLLAGAFQVFDGVQAVAAGGLRGLKDTFYPMVIGLVSYWGIGLPLGYFLMAGQGARGLWTGLIAGLACASVALTWRWVRLSPKPEVGAVRSGTAEV